MWPLHLQMEITQCKIVSQSVQPGFGKSMISMVPQVVFAWILWVEVYCVNRIKKLSLYFMNIA